MVFQHFNLFPHMTVLENITFAPVEHKRLTQDEANKLGMELLEKVGLADKADANLTAYRVVKSSGWQLLEVWP